MVFHAKAENVRFNDELLPERPGHRFSSRSVGRWLLLEIGIGFYSIFLGAPTVFEIFSSLSALFFTEIKKSPNKTGGPMFKMRGTECRTRRSLTRVVCIAGIPPPATRSQMLGDTL